MGRRRKRKGKTEGARPPLQNVDAPASTSPKIEDEDKGRRSPVRRGRVPTLLVAALIAAAAAIALWHWRPAFVGRGFSPRTLNVIIVTADTLRADKLGCYGNRDVATPHLDRMASEGVLFENATTSAPLTLPAHASIFTGTYPIYHGVRDNGGYYLSNEHVTLAEILRERGYATGAFVGAFVLDSRWGLDQGFDRYFDDFDIAELQDAGLDAVYRRGDDVLGEALDWMGSVKDRPFLSWIHLYDPHRPYDPPEPYRNRYADAPWGSYDGEIAFVDSLVGELREWLATKGLLDSTLMVFVGDHGEALGDHDELTHGFFVYGATMQVPFLLRAPYPGFRARRVAAQVRTIDILSTVLELVGADPPAAAQGTSLVPLALGRADDLGLTAYGESVFPGHYGWSPLASLRNRRFHFIEAPRPELYDLEADPGERVNLASTRAGTVRQFRSELEKILDRYGSEDSGNTAATLMMDAETRRRLEALGYLGAGTSVAVHEPDRPAADPKDKIGLFKLIREASTDTGDGRWDEALEKLEHVVAEDPLIPEAYNILGNVYEKQGDLEKAASAYREALGLDPDYKPAIFSLALTYKEMKRFEEAETGFERILELDPRASQAAFLLADLRIETHRFEQALEVLVPFEATQGTGREAATLHLLTAECYLGLEKVKEAKTELDRTLAIEPERPDALYTLGVLHEKRGELAQAAEAYEKELQINPTSFRAHFNLAKLRGQAGRETEMIEHLTKSIEANPSFAIGHLYLANAYLERGDLERALELAKKGIALRPEPALAPFGHFILADIYQRLGRVQDAAREMALAQKLRQGH